VSEAAEKLGVTPSAVRKRVERGTLIADKDEDGRLFVYIDTCTTRRDTSCDSPTTSQGAEDTTSRDTRRQSRDELVEELRDRMGELREQVGFLRAELERKDAILMTLAQRVPELEPAREAPSELREEPETASGGMEGVEVPLAEEKRSWWRRLFGP